MPKVSKIKFEIEGKSSEFDIHYNKEDKFFIKNFPLDIRNKVPSSGINESRFETERELIEFYTNLIKEYHKIISKTKKIIAYYISAPKNFQNFTEVSKKIKEMLGYAGDDKNTFGFTVTYQICLQQTGNGNIFYDINEDGTVGKTVHVPTHMSIIVDYTPEREAFLKNMEQKMKDMFLRMIDLMMDEEKFISLVDSNIKLLG
jgi:hypothetical protein